VTEKRLLRLFEKENTETGERKRDPGWKAESLRAPKSGNAKKSSEKGEVFGVPAAED